MDILPEPLSQLDCGKQNTNQQRVMGKQETTRSLTRIERSFAAGMYGFAAGTLASGISGFIITALRFGFCWLLELNPGKGEAASVIFMAVIFACLGLYYRSKCFALTKQAQILIFRLSNLVLLSSGTFVLTGMILTIAFHVSGPIAFAGAVLSLLITAFVNWKWSAIRFRGSV